MFNWFSSTTDGTLEYLHNNYLNNCLGIDFPLTGILLYFSERRKTTVFNTNTINDHTLRYFLLHLLYVETHNRSAFNVKLKNNEPHIDHIFPKSKLVKAPFSLSASEINTLGNYRFVGATDNIRKRAEIPETYFLTLKNSGINIERHLLVKRFSDDPSNLLMNVVIYRTFRDERRDLIYKILEPIINFI